MQAPTWGRAEREEASPDSSDSFGERAALLASLAADALSGAARTAEVDFAAYRALRRSGRLPTLAEEAADLAPALAPALAPVRRAIGAAVGGGEDGGRLAAFAQQDAPE